MEVLFTVHILWLCEDQTTILRINTNINILGNQTNLVQYAYHYLNLSVNENNSLLDVVIHVYKATNKTQFPCSRFYFVTRWYFIKKAVLHIMK